MRPRTDYTRKRRPDDDERIQAALMALERHLPGIDTAKEEISFRVFLHGQEPNEHPKPKAIKPVGLTETRKQIDALCKKGRAFADALETINENANIMGELYSHGLDIKTLQEQVRQSIRFAREVQGRLPKGKKWPKMPNPLHDLLRQLAAAYEDRTRKPALLGVKHSREPEKFYGPFFDLVMDVCYQLDLPEKSNTALGQAIHTALEQDAAD